MSTATKKRAGCAGNVLFLRRVAFVFGEKARKPSDEKAAEKVFAGAPGFAPALGLDALEAPIEDLAYVLRGERLAEVIVGTMAKGADRRFHVGIAGDDDAYQIGEQPAKRGQQFQAVPFPQSEVQEKAAGPTCYGDGKRVLGGVGRLGRVAVNLQRFRHSRGKIVIVVHHQDRLAGLRLIRLGRVGVVLVHAGRITGCNPPLREGSKNSGLPAGFEET